jgi:hypothetical protein
MHGEKLKVKTIASTFVLAVAVLLAVAGCKKADTAPNSSTPAGALAAVRKAFPNPSADVFPSIDKISFGLRYGEYQGVLAELDKLSANPNLTPDQKKALADASEQVKKSMAAAHK